MSDSGASVFTLGTVLKMSAKKKKHLVDSQIRYAIRYTLG